MTVRKADAISFSILHLLNPVLSFKIISSKSKLIFFNLDPLFSIYHFMKLEFPVGWFDMRFYLFFYEVKVNPFTITVIVLVTLFTWLFRPACLIFSRRDWAYYVKEFKQISFREYTFAKHFPNVPMYKFQHPYDTIIDIQADLEKVERMAYEGSGPMQWNIVFPCVYESMACAFHVIYDLIHVPVTGVQCTMMTIVMRLS